MKAPISIGTGQRWEDNCGDRVQVQRVDNGNVYCTHVGPRAYGGSASWRLAAFLTRFRRIG